MIATVFWVYLILQTFFLDVDQEVIVEFLPAGQAIADYKFLIFIAVLIVFVLLLDRADVIRALLYVAFFPLVVGLWKLPRILYRTNSWVVFLSTANVVSSGVVNIRGSILAFGATLGSVVLILAIDNPALVGIGIAIVVFLLAGALYRAIRYAFTPSSFLRTQEHAIQRIVGSEGVAALVEVNEELKSNSVTKFDEQQQTTFLNNLQFGLMAHRTLFFWAYQLDRYRKSSAPIVFNIVAFLALLVGIIFGLALINLGLYKIDPNAFSYDSTPSLLSMGRYAFTSLYGSEIAAI